MASQNSSFVTGSGAKKHPENTSNIVAWLSSNQGKMVLAFIVGVFLGLVILGWGPLKVKYIDTTTEYLREDLRTDYARMIIDSYTTSHIANPQYAEQMALARLNSLGDYASEELQKIVRDPQIQNMNDILTIQELYKTTSGISTTTPQETENSTAPVISPEEQKQGNLIKSLGLALLSVALLAIAGFAIFLFLRQNQSNKRPTPKVSYRDTDEINNFVQTTYQSKDGIQLTPDQHFFTTYRIGNDLYEKRESIISKVNKEYLGECGVEVVDFIGVGTPKRASAFEVYVFDSHQPGNTAKVLLCEHAFSDKNVYERLKHKGEFILLEPNKDIPLETENLQVIIRIKEMHYGTAPLPENSYIEQITFEFSVWEKASLRIQ